MHPDRNVTLATVALVALASGLFFQTVRLEALRAQYDNATGLLEEAATQEDACKQKLTEAEVSCGERVQSCQTSREDIARLAKACMQKLFHAP